MPLESLSPRLVLEMRELLSHTGCWYFSARAVVIDVTLLSKRKLSVTLRLNLLLIHCLAKGQCSAIENPLNYARN